MPLSDHEQRLLEQIERALYAEDPKFASTVSSTNLRTHARRRILRASIAFILGIGALLGGVIAQQPWLSIVGFLIMFGSVVLALSASKRMFGKPELRVVGGKQTAKPTRGKSAPKQRQAKSNGSFLQRMEERFRRRFDER